MVPEIKLTDNAVFYGGNRIGREAVEMHTGNIVLCMWKPLFRIKDSYSLSLGALDQIDDDIDYYYITDTDTGDVFKFRAETYGSAPIFHFNSQRQLIPDKSEYEDMWENAEEEIFD